MNRIILSLALATSFVTSSVMAEEENMIAILKPMHKFAVECEKTVDKVAILGEKDSDDVFQYSAAQIEPILVLDTSNSEEEIKSIEKDMTDKGLLKCINKADLIHQEI